MKKSPSAPAQTSPLGICCPRCGGRQLRAVFTRYRRGAIVRVRQCKRDGCGHRVRTAERLESLTG